MKNQPVPNVSPDDVARVARRDFPDVPPEDVIALLDEFRSNHADRGSRVKLAVLKVSAGNVDDLLCNIELAISDYRDVICPAEYPLHSANGWSYQYQPGEEEETFQQDWDQYQEWLQRE